MNCVNASKRRVSLCLLSLSDEQAEMRDRKIMDWIMMSLSLLIYHSDFTEGKTLRSLSVSRFQAQVVYV